ncbi:AfsR/SARP family transcriptional regulator [Kitasatospora sp. NBC_01302]|uniref:AfsR/SARP family transcriptional regulator n=1 Tax=Kitasatospora sp. NBC_01302 TaxID=2903575 RepID=UPI002E11BA1E|nr:AfsR/SARP family transcriptional regulator [Kitasatospora sp. NBC_01302]
MSGSTGTQQDGDGATRFTVLGLLAIADRRETAVLQPSKPATLLAALLVRPNAVVSVEWLQRAIWGEETPATAKAALHSCVLRLRRLFAKYGIAGHAIEALPGGYRMAVDTGTLDLLEFRELLRRADQAADQKAELGLLREALALWQLPVLGNVPSDALHREEVPRLTEEWLRTAERAYDIELALGRCREVLAELWSAARSHPVHERFWEQLIEALYRTGRRADALAEYRRVRDHLLEELGVDPGPALRRLELSILRGESVTTTTTAATTATATGAATTATTARAGAPDGLHGPDERALSAPATARTAIPAIPAAPAAATGPDPQPGPADRAGVLATPSGPVSGELVLAGLVQAGLLREGPPGRYQVHDLLLAFTRAATGSWTHAPATGPPADGVGRTERATEHPRPTRLPAAPLRRT